MSGYVCFITGFLGWDLTNVGPRQFQICPLPGGPEYLIFFKNYYYTGLLTFYISIYATLLLLLGITQYKLVYQVNHHVQ